MIRVCTAHGSDLGWAVVIDITNTHSHAKDKGSSAHNDTHIDCDWSAAKASRYVISAALFMNTKGNDDNHDNNNDDKDKKTLTFIQAPLPLVTAISAVKVTITQRTDSPPSVSSHQYRISITEEVDQGLRYVSQRYGDNVPLLDPVTDLKIAAAEYEPLKEKLDNLREQFVKASSSPPSSYSKTSRSPSPLVLASGETTRTTTMSALNNDNSPSLSLTAKKGDGLTITTSSSEEKVAQCIDELEVLKTSMRESHLALFQEELKSRSRVLKRLGHIDENDIVLLKGRAACQIDTSDELMAAELMFDGTFSQLDHHCIAAVASCLIPTEKSQEEVKLKTVLDRSLRALQEAATRIAELSKECGLEIDVEEYVESFTPDLMDVVYSWSKGADFGAITNQTSLFEGSIVRAMRRLDELLQQLSCAADAVGDKVLEQKFMKASESIRRGIVFSNSLYIAEE